MEFLKYPSIENKVSPPTPDTLMLDWVVTEKVHGANFQLDFNHETKEITACRRNAKLDNSEKFYQFEKIIERYSIAMTLLSKQIGLRSFRVYGELFGGGYPIMEQKDKTKVRAKGMVQKDILYCKEIDFIVFDIYELGESPKWLNWDNVKDYCNKSGFKVVPELYRGKFNISIEFNPNDLITKVPELYNLPEIRGNIMEGIVVRPVQEPQASLDVKKWPHDHVVRQMYKIRTKSYEETKYIKVPKIPKERDHRLIAQLALVQGYVTRNRFNAVKSKELPIQSMKEIPKYIKLMTEDIKKDATADGIDVEDNVYSMLKTSIAILVRTEISTNLR